MRHRKKTKILGRKKAARTSLYKNLAESIILYEKVTTTQAKAKAIRPVVERLITVGKEPSLTARRKLLQYLPTELAVKKVLEVLGPRYETRPGGYLRIRKIGTRANDAAPMVRIEFV
ncbi:50S ribosomal protein L17 [Candidatus Uhrbacteria bacterium CG_4_9_14_3_um_filter_36_7]|uniref:50S ribosomal protein L17 n=1 Tax=Candidatus Uhrbacteria bacterium CG_4_9_14_3_um_filter_36_7 TaxID=1975033 RepID=A0A2M7XI77_9BACT|nr:MAG: 50S ribosomal protein L17 [Candidatus Uhrbacteria bacterium CG_4_9_14_3_um_filter_36_7]